MKSKHVGFLAALAVGLFVLFFSVKGRAADAALTWTHPTQYTDGSAISAGALTQTSILYGLCNAGATGLLASPAPVTVVVPQPGSARTITGLGNGKWCFAVRAETAAEQSDFTAFVAKDIVLKPKPPTGLIVTAQTAYMAVRQGDRYVMVPVGTVPGGTSCDSNNGVIAGSAAYYAVPASAVTWYGSTQSTVALARCS
jgi:hypothetical protein